jgi:hypothetical protein
MKHATSELVRSFNSSGLTQKDYCTRHKIALSTLQYHLRKSRKFNTRKKKVANGNFLPLLISNQKSPSKVSSKTLLLLHGEISTEELSELFGMVLR